MTRQKIQPSYSGAVLAAGILVAFWSSVPLPTAQAAVIKGHTVHVEVLLQRSDGQPVGYLTAKDFVASQQAKALPLTVIRPVLGNKPPKGHYVPTRMLVILAPPIANSGNVFPSLLAALRPVWQRGWQVAIAQSNGSATNYATTGAQLQQMWTTPAKSNVTAEAAVENLKSFMGRSLVLYLAGSQKGTIPPQKWLLQGATEAMARMFVVDGGVSTSADPLPATRSRPYGMSMIPDTAFSRTGRVGAFGSHELNVRKAVKDAMRAALGYYNLRIKYPSAGSIPSDATLSLEIKKSPPLLVTAQIYGKIKVPQLKVTTK